MIGGSAVTTRESFNAECARLCEDVEGWVLRRQPAALDPFNRERAYLIATYPLERVATTTEPRDVSGEDQAEGNRRSASAVDGSKKDVAEAVVCWSEDDDDDIAHPTPPVKKCSSAASSDPSTYSVRMYITYNECFRCPEAHFEILSTPTGDPRRAMVEQSPAYIPVDDLRTVWGMRGICDAERDGQGLIVSMSGFCEELQRALYSVHQCDTSTLLHLAGDSNVVNHEGSVVMLFLMMVGPLLGLPTRYYTTKRNTS